MASYLTADGETTALVGECMHRWHRELESHGVSVVTLFAYATVDENTGLEKGPALKDRGVQVRVLAKINPLRERVQGLTDFTIQIDGKWWQETDDLTRLAAIDHGLRQVEIVCDDEGQAKLDDALRPKLRKRPVDFCAAGFTDVVSRHPGRSLEEQAVRTAAGLVQEALIGAETSQPEPVSA